MQESYAEMLVQKKTYHAQLILYNTKQENSLDDFVSELYNIFHK